MSQWTRAVHFTHYFSFDVNCVTLRAFACRSGASAAFVSLCVFVCVRACRSAVACACVSGCMRICAHVRVTLCAHTQSARACVRGGRREEPGLSYFKLFLLSDCLASQLSLCLSSVFASISSSHSCFPHLLGWMMAYDCPDGCGSPTLALARLRFAS